MQNEWQCSLWWMNLDCVCRYWCFVISYQLNADNSPLSPEPCYRFYGCSLSIWYEHQTNGFIFDYTLMHHMTSVVNSWQTTEGFFGCFILVRNCCWVYIEMRLLSWTSDFERISGSSLGLNNLFLTSTHPSTPQLSATGFFSITNRCPFDDWLSRRFSFCFVHYR